MPVATPPHLEIAYASAGTPAKFSGPFTLVTLPGVGRFPTREAADVADALVRHFRA